MNEAVFVFHVTYLQNRPVGLGEESGKGDRIQQTQKSNSASVSDHEGITVCGCV